jgi:Holliday junction resolvase RusA-like endonuclease
MKRIDFVVPGHPRPQTRQQFHVLRRKQAAELVQQLRSIIELATAGRYSDTEAALEAMKVATDSKNYVAVPFPDDTKDEKERIAAYCVRAMHAARADRHPGPVALLVALKFHLPDSISKRERMERLWHTQTPDADNCLKLVKDALNGVAWDDDRQVVMPIPWKTWTAGDDGYHVTVLQLSPAREQLVEEWRSVTSEVQRFLQEAASDLLSGRLIDASGGGDFAQGRLGIG